MHRDGGVEFILGMATQESQPDVLVLAGDICGAEQIENVLAQFYVAFPKAIILYVHGNHEFYGSDRKSVVAKTKRAVRGRPRLHWLDCTSVEIENVSFHGTPLWFRRAPAAPKHQLNDFNLIRDYESWVYRENERALLFLRHEVQPGDVVITHHLPTAASISPQYRGDPLNAFFLCDVEALMRECRPQLWVHGHGHNSADYRCGVTHVVANPCGYPGVYPTGWENGRFDPNLLIEVAENDSVVAKTATKGRS
jgi:predicted phosphohydrolase